MSATHNTEPLGGEAREFGLEASPLPLSLDRTLIMISHL